MKLNYLALASLALGISLANADRDRTFGDGELPEMLCLLYTSDAADE